MSNAISGNNFGFPKSRPYHIVDVPVMNEALPHKIL